MNVLVCVMPTHHFSLQMNSSNDFQSNFECFSTHYVQDRSFFYYYYCFFFFTEGRQDMQKLRTEHSIDSFANCHEMRIYLLGC